MPCLPPVNVAIFNQINLILNLFKQSYCNHTTERNPTHCMLEIYSPLGVSLLHWGRVTYICTSRPTIIGSDEDLLPSLRQAIILTNSGILLIEPLSTNFREIWSEIHTFSLKKVQLKMSSENGSHFVSAPMCWTYKLISLHLGIQPNAVISTKLSECDYSPSFSVSAILWRIVISDDF